MKEKALRHFKGKEKERFDENFRKLQAFKRTIEDLSEQVFDIERVVWDMINLENLYTNCKFRYDMRAGKIYECKGKEQVNRSLSRNSRRT